MLNSLAARGLEDFVTTSTMNFFTKARLPSGFLDKAPSEWDSDESYQASSAAVRQFRCVNDTAERSVGLIKEFTVAGLTKNENQLQSILKIVKKNREECPKLTKMEIIKTEKL